MYVPQTSWMKRTRKMKKKKKNEFNLDQQFNAYRCGRICTCLCALIQCGNFDYNSKRFQLRPCNCCCVYWIEYTYAVRSILSIVIYLLLYRPIMIIIVVLLRCVFSQSFIVLLCFVDEISLCNDVCSQYSDYT